MVLHKSALVSHRCQAGILDSRDWVDCYAANAELPKVF
jgi:hypothetical protein